MSFANAVNAGINVGTAAFGPLAQSLDPLRRLQADRIRAETAGLQGQNALLPLQTRSIQQAIALREQEIEQLKQSNQLMAEFFGETAKQQFLAENDPLLQGATRFQKEQQIAAMDPSRQPGFVGPPTPFDQISAGSLSQLHQPYPQASGAYQRAAQAAPPAALDAASRLRSIAKEGPRSAARADFLMSRGSIGAALTTQPRDFGRAGLAPLAGPFGAFLADAISRGITNPVDLSALTGGAVTPLQIEEALREAGIDLESLTASPGIGAAIDAGNYGPFRPGSL